jgi:uncharacterized protein
MQNIGPNLFLSAHDLVGHLNCAHLTDLDTRVARGELAKPGRWDPLLEILRERGQRHEQAFIDHLKSNGFSPVAIDGVEINDETVAFTLQAMQAGHQIIVQAALRDGRWLGRADILRRVNVPSALGAWSYEIIDTKLARETKGGTVLQLCLYADLLKAMQGAAPEFVYVVAPFSNFEPQRFRFADYAAFLRKAVRAAETAADASGSTKDETYPDPKEHCDVCRWESQCDARRREDDHLCLVANVRKLQINELRSNGVVTAKALSELPLPLPWKPKRGAPESYARAQGQARVQVEARETGRLRHELLPVEPGTGLCILPAPSAGDVFFDLEGDPFIRESGLEYLFGYWYRDAAGNMRCEADWAIDRASEKVAFETFIDFVTARRADFPDMHIFHYAPYEPAALKRLMGRYATRQTEVDNLLRGKVLVDLYSAVRNGLRASVESYSIKKLEPFYAFQRELPLSEANIALAQVQAALEFGDAEGLGENDRVRVATYNKDDCRSTEALRHWLERLRTEAIAQGITIDRPSPGEDGPSEDTAEAEATINALTERLTHDIPIDPLARSHEQQACWILAHSLAWHVRELKAVWWEHFRLAGLTPEELLDEKAGLGGLVHIGTVGRTKTGIPIDRYRFTPQDSEIREDASVRSAGGHALGTVESISEEELTVDIKKTKATANTHPLGVYEHKVIGTDEQQASLLRLGNYVAEHGISGAGPNQSARDLLLRELPRLGSVPLHVDNEDTLQKALRLTPALTCGVLPIQGPPGTGKSFTGAQMIAKLIREGHRIGIIANSHKVVRNLIDESVKACISSGQAIAAGQKLTVKEPRYRSRPHIYGQCKGSQCC